MTKSDQEDADEQFPVVEPWLLQDAMRAIRLPRDENWRPGSTAARVTVELTALQAQFLSVRGRRRFGVDDDAEAIRREIEQMVSQETRSGVANLYRRTQPWLGIMKAARRRLRKAEQGE